MRKYSLRLATVMITAAVLPRLWATEAFAESKAEAYGAVYNVVEDFGAYGSDKISDRAAIQAALEKARLSNNHGGEKILVSIPAGTYYIDGSLMVFSNTDVVLADGARIVRTDLTSNVFVGVHENEEGKWCGGSSCTHTGYGVVENVSISGGIIDGGVGDNTDISCSSAIVFENASGLTIRDTEITNFSAFHMITLDGVNGVTVENVRFCDNRMFTGEDDLYFGDIGGKKPQTDEEYAAVARVKETVHIDFSEQLDGTYLPCKNVSVKGCSFENVLAGVGAHHSEKEFSSINHSGITVENNSFKDLPGVVVNAVKVNGMTVTGNNADGFQSFIYSESSDITVRDNTVKNSSLNAVDAKDSTVTVENNEFNGAGNSKSAVKADKCSGSVTVRDNIIKNAWRGIFVTESDKALVRGNTVSDCSDLGVMLNGVDRAEVSENEVYNNGAAGDIMILAAAGGFCTGNTVTDCPAENIYTDSAVTVSGNIAKNPKNGFYKADGITVFYRDGVKTVNEWAEADGARYYFAGGGRMVVSSWIETDGEWFYVGADGKMLIGLQKIGGYDYYFDTDGVNRNGWAKVDGSWYYFNRSSNRMYKSAWLNDGGVYYYLGSDGRMAIGWRKLDNTWYYFGSSGAMATGWIKLGGAWYYLGTSGKMVTGWQKIGSEWYYFVSGGQMVSGWKKLNNVWYYFDNGGAMSTGWEKVGGTWYYFDGSGKMATGWVRVGAKWYYMDGSGAMQTGWLKLGNKWYYLSPDGAMVTGTQKISGKVYRFSSSGQLL